MEIPVSAGATESDVAVLEQPYLLVTFIPCYRDDTGARWLEQTWHHDLMEHLRYITDLTLCAPSLPKGVQSNLVRVNIPSDVRLRYADLPSQTSGLKALLALPRTVARLWRAIGQADIVHSAVIGWPYPLGWIANPFAVWRGKGLVIVVESSWRRGDTERRTWKIRIWDAISESLARWSCKRANVALFTHSTYRDTLHTGGRGAAYVTPAVWINEIDILDEAIAEALWTSKLAEPVRVLFAGRLVAGKGINVLLSALRILDGRGVNAQVDIIGEGDRRKICEQAARTFRCVCLSILDPVPYGRPFFDVVRRYQALLVPSLTDEQPRIVFDANAQAVAVIASNTAGLRPHVEHGRTGWLLPSGDAEALARMIERAMAAAPKLRSMGMAALATTHGHTHVAMHRTRSHILKQHFSGSA